MGRPTLDLGTYGTIACKEQPNGAWRATAQYRDYDGVTRPVGAFAPTKAKAEAKLRAKLRDRQKRHGGTGELTPESTVADLGTLWIAHMQLAHDQAVKIGARPKPNQDSLDQYARCIEKVILPDLAKVRLRELRPQRVDRFLRALPSNVRMAKTVLSQMCDLGVQYEALDINPTLRGYVPPRAEVDRRTLTPDAAVEFRRLVREWQHRGRGGVMQDTAQRGYDRLRIVDVLLGTGIRIGEVLSLAWDDIHDLDSDHPTAYIGWHLDKAARRVEGRKSGGRPYTVSLTPLAVEALQEQRSVGIPYPLVFPTRNGTPHSEANVRRDLRAARGAEMEWVVPKTMRKTVSTAVYEAKGLEAAQRQLGHATPETTRRHYVNPSDVAPDNRAALAEYSCRKSVAEPQKQEEAG